LRRFILNQLWARRPADRNGEFANDVAPFYKTTPIRTELRVSRFKYPFRRFVLNRLRAPRLADRNCEFANDVARFLQNKANPDRVCRVPGLNAH
jgi:hypothetical protein